jgi:hypothetical protein
MPRPAAQAAGRASAMKTYPTVDESRTRLHRAGWSVGEIATATRWLVSGGKGDDLRPRRGG